MKRWFSLLLLIALLCVLALPAAVALCLFWLPVDPMLKTIVILTAGFPTGSIPLMFCMANIMILTWRLKERIFI